MTPASAPANPRYGCDQASADVRLPADPTMFALDVRLAKDVFARDESILATIVVVPRDRYTRQIRLSLPDAVFNVAVVERSSGLPVVRKKVVQISTIRSAFLNSECPVMQQWQLHDWFALTPGDYELHVTITPTEKDLAGNWVAVATEEKHVPFSIKR